MLRLVESGKIRVSDKTRRPVPGDRGGDRAVARGRRLLSARRPVASIRTTRGADLTIRAFAWPCLLQAAGLVTLSGGKLGLSPAGRKALVRPAQEGIRAAWEKWVGTSLFDEFERIEAIKGKQAARLGAVADRRRAVSGVLARVPGRPVDRHRRVLPVPPGHRTPISRWRGNEWKLYIAELQYGSFGYAWTL